MTGVRESILPNRPTRHFVRAAALLSPVAGISFAIALLTLFTIASGFTLSRDSLVRVVKNALDAGQMHYLERTNEDFFTECALLTLQYFRHDGAVLNAVSTRWISTAHHPCHTLAALSAGPPYTITVPEPYNYASYPFGSRHLAAPVLSALSYAAAKTLYRFLSYGSVVFLLLGAWRNSPATSLMLAPVGAFLLFGFAQPSFADNLGHAPGYFVGFFGLGFLLMARGWFGNTSCRFAFFGLLGTLVAYFDLLHGSIPVVLSLAIMINQLFYVGKNRDVLTRDYWLASAWQGLAIAGCFLAAYAMLTSFRLLALSFYGFQWYSFFPRLSARMGSEIPGHIVTFRDLVDKLWLARFQLTPGGAVPATWLVCASLAAWIYAACLLGLSYLRHGKAIAILLPDLFVTVAAGAGAVAWFLMFANHTYIHSLFIVRIVALPEAYGFVAAALVTRFLLRASSGWVVWTPAVTALASFFAAANVLHRLWSVGVAPEIRLARFVEQPADKVSCAVLGLKADGQTDGLIEIKYWRSMPPLAFLGLRTDRHGPMYMMLHRSNPAGIYATGPGVYPLGITSTPAGELLNRPDGSFFPAGNSAHLWVHFCRDGHDTPNSVYRLSIGGKSIVIEP